MEKRNTPKIIISGAANVLLNLQNFYQPNAGTSDETIKRF
jgi:hypothetical protein